MDTKGINFQKNSFPKAEIKYPLFIKLFILSNINSEELMIAFALVLETRVLSLL